MFVLIRILIFVLIAGSSSYAVCKPYNDDFFSETNRGWFFYEICETKKDNATKDNETYSFIPETVTIPWNVLDKIDPDDIQAIETKNRKIALMYPTDGNLIEYKRLIAWMTNKSTVYSRADTRVRTLYPETSDYAMSIPTNIWAKDQQRVNTRQLRADTLKKYVDKVGVIVFATEECPYCREQKSIMDMLSQEYGYTYDYLYISNVPNTAIEFNVTTVPDIFMIYKNEVNGEAVWQRISTGLTSYPDLIKGILRGLLLLGEDINESLTY
jgi:thiol-disulfide isomerase/thioredoxin